MTRSVEICRAHIKIAAWMLAVCAVGFVAFLLVETQTDLNGWTGMMLGGTWFVIFAIRIIWLRSRLQTLRANTPETSTDAASETQ